MMNRASLLITGSLLLLLSSAPLTSQAQGWAQEAEVITTINYDGPINVLLDSLRATLERNPDTRVQRSPQDSTSRSFRDLQETLNEEGVGLSSASHAFVRYRFDLTKDGDNVVETIQDIHFILRVDERNEDISIMHVRLEAPLIRKLINTRGIVSEMNLKTLRTFRDLMAFPTLTASLNSSMVGVDDRRVRGQKRALEQQNLIEIFRKRGYVLDSGPDTPVPTRSATRTSASR